MAPEHDPHAPAAVQIAHLAWRADAIDEWRKDLDAWRGVVDEKLDGLVSAREIAEAVARALRREQEQEDRNKVTIGNMKLARWQAWLGFVAVLAAIASPYIQAATS